MIVALLVMLFVGFVMGVVVTEILVARPERRDANESLRVANRATATAKNWEKVADQTMRTAYWVPKIDPDNQDHSKQADLRIVTQ